MPKLGGLIGFLKKTMEMKYLNRYFWGLSFGLATVCAMTFSACSDDDEDNGGSGTTAEVENPLVTEGGVLLTSLKYYGSSSPDDEYTFWYDDQLRPYEASDEYETLFSIDYEHGMMSMPVWGGASGLAVSFNAKGYLTKIKGSWSYKEDGETYSGSADWSMSYDKEDHLTAYTMVSETRESEYYEKGNFKATFTWSNGNLVSAKVEDKWTDGKTEEAGTTVNTFTYGNQVNKFKQYPAYFFASDIPFFAVGMFGVGPNMLPTSYEEVANYEEEGEKGGYQENGTFTFTLNDNGSINTETWAYEEKENNETYTGTYKYVFGYSVASASSKALTRNAALPELTQTERAKQVRELMHKKPFMLKKRGQK